VYFLSASRWPSASALPTGWPPRTESIAVSTALRSRPASRARRPASPLSSVSASKEQLGRDELVAALAGLFLAQVQQVDQVAADLDIAARARHLRQPLDRAVQGSLQPRHPHAGALEQRPARAVRLTDQGAQQVHRLDVLVVVVQGEALGIGQGLLELGGEFIQTHGFDTRSGVWLCQR
jgi:hypothetical protein